MLGRATWREGGALLANALRASARAGARTRYRGLCAAPRADSARATASSVAAGGAGQQRALTLVQHKPYSFLSPSTAPRGNKRFAIELLTAANKHGGGRANPDPSRVRGLTCAGRLDADSTGLMLWTTDARLAEHVISARSRLEKEYLVRVQGHADWSQAGRDGVIEFMRSGGVHLDGAPLRPARAKWLNEAQLQIVLTEGRHRQIRRMCAIVGLEVTALKRVRIGPIALRSLPVGRWTILPPSMEDRLVVEMARGRGGPGRQREPD